MKKAVILLFFIFCSLIPACHASRCEWISIANNASLPDETVSAVSYPASLSIGSQQYDLESLLHALLGEGYYILERSPYDHKEQYRSADGDEPWEYRTAAVSDDDQSFSYRNPWINGERGGEYEAPSMNMLPDESLVLCRILLNEVISETWTTDVNPISWIRDRWDNSGRWMTDDEYAAYYRRQKGHYFTFSHLTEEGVPIQADRVFANIGVDGLASVEISWHDYTVSNESVYPMSLKEAIEMANSTREAPCTLLYAGLIYSNWLTEDDTQNLSWYLATDAGNYVVDCVLKKHRCDCYEY